MKTLPVHECFYTWQGEGCHMGKPAFFIRLFGCPVHCPWCDSAGTWHPDHIPDTINRFTVDALLEAVRKRNPEIVVITGGEPTIHDLTALTSALQHMNLPVHLETAGCFEIRGSFDWITLSPKVWKKPISVSLTKADEFKIIVDKPEIIDLWEREIGSYFTGKPVWLHPEWSQRDNPEIMQAINSAVKDRKHRYRAGYQLHKLYGVDEENTVNTKLTLPSYTQR